MDFVAFLKKLTNSPGVYQFFDATGQVIYVGKAKNLRKRVSSYFSRQLDKKTQTMLAKVVNIEVLLAASENDALLLESDLIKSLKPRYNIVLRDDKSYPFLYLSTQQRFARLDFYRGKKQEQGEFFGPYPSASAVRENLALIQKLFRLRQCSDSFFKHRTRPCLQYQIKRCTAPCVGLVSEAEYSQQVAHTIGFLRGKSHEVMDNITGLMEAAAKRLHYEEAAHYRDQIDQLRRLQNQQTHLSGKRNIDVIGVAQYAGRIGFTVLSIRDGRMLGKRSYFPKLPLVSELGEALSAFIAQYYLNTVRQNDLPQKVIASERITDRLWLQNALQSKLSSKLVLSDQKTAASLAWQKMAVTNTLEALRHFVAEKSQVAEQLLALQESLSLSYPIQRIECFDVSHTQGEATVASCVVFNEAGSAHQDYRRYSISGITSGDDYAAMRQALERRYARLKREAAKLPDLLIIDGGKGQLHAAAEVMETLQISGLALLGVAKGVERKPGAETLWLYGQEKPLSLRPDSIAFHLIQHIRDEAHRFAISSHRAKRAKARSQSLLQSIQGVGVARRQRLLTHFGGLQGLMKASVQDIAAVSGINAALAEKIFKFLHSQ